MIEYFKIPSPIMINQTVTKKLFAEKISLTSVEKRLLKNDISSIVMKALFQSRNTGLEIFQDEVYLYNQLLICEVEIKTQSKRELISNMIQRAFPTHLFLIIHSEKEYCINWCNKKINQVEIDKRILEEQNFTRWFDPLEDNLYMKKWIQSLDITKLKCDTLKDLFDKLSLKLTSLSIADETGEFVNTDGKNIDDYKSILCKIRENRDEQKEISKKLKNESQFNEQLQLNKQLRKLQDLNKMYQKQLRESSKI